jgi:hypothetical protein
MPQKLSCSGATQGKGNTFSAGTEEESDRIESIE